MLSEDKEFYIAPWANREDFVIPSIDLKQHVPSRPAGVYHRTIGFDFDGVLHSYTGYKGNNLSDLDKPVPGAIEFLEDLRSEGYYIVIVSSRPIVGIIPWLDEHSFTDKKLYDVVSNKKIPCRIYLDDQVITFKGIFDGRLKEQIIRQRPWWKD